MKFGEFFHKRRIELGFTLRKFSETFDEDPAYISRLERGKVPAPKVPAKLNYYAHALGMKEGTEDYEKFFRLASISNKTYGIDQVENEKILEKLPVFLRTLDNKGLNESDLDKLIELIRDS